MRLEKQTVAQTVPIAAAARGYDYSGFAGGVLATLLAAAVIRLIVKRRASS
jgi:hypothetical protein